MDGRFTLILFLMDGWKKPVFFEKPVFCKRLFRKRVSLRNPFSCNINFCYRDIEKFGIVATK